MKRSNKLLALLCAGFLLPLTGCGSKPSSNGDPHHNPPGPPDPGPGDETRISVEQMKEYLQGFDEPGVSVDICTTIDSRYSAHLKIDGDTFEIDLNQEYTSLFDSDEYSTAILYPYILSASLVDDYGNIKLNGDFYQYDPEGYYVGESTDCYFNELERPFLLNYLRWHVLDSEEMYYFTYLENEDIYYAERWDIKIQLDENHRITKYIDEMYSRISDESLPYEITFTYGSNIILPSNLEVATAFSFLYNQDEDGYYIDGGVDQSFKENVVPKKHFGKNILGFTSNFHYYSRITFITLNDEILEFQVPSSTTLRVTVTNPNTKVDPGYRDCEIVYPGQTSKIVIEENTFAYTVDPISGERTLLKAQYNRDYITSEWKGDDLGYWNIYHIPGSFQYIEEDFLAVNVDGIEFQEGVKEIYDIIFSSLKYVSIPNSLVYINENFNYQYRDYTTVLNNNGTVVDNVIYLGNSNNPYVAAVKITDDYNKEELTLHDGCYLLARSVFDYNDYLKEFTANDVRYLSDDSLRCELDRLTINSSSVFISDYAYTLSEQGKVELNVSEVRWQNDQSSPDLGNRSYNQSYFTNDNGVIYYGSSTNPYFILVDVEGEATSVSINENCRYIFSGAFNYLGVVDIYIPETVRQIAKHVSEQQYNQATVHIGICTLMSGESFSQNWTVIMDEENPYFNVEGLYIYSLDNKKLYYGPKSGAITLKAEVEYIACSFYDLDLTYEGTIEQYLNIVFTNYYGPRSLTIDDEIVRHLVIPEGVKEIPNYAFENNKEIRSVTFPDTLEDIGFYAFCNCESLSEINFGSGDLSISYSAFENVAVRNLTIPSNVKYLGQAFSRCFFYSVTIEEGALEGRCDHPFSWCTIYVLKNFTTRSEDQLGLNYSTKVYDYVTDQNSEDYVEFAGGFTLIHHDNEVWLVKYDADITGSVTINIPSNVTKICGDAFRELDPQVGQEDKIIINVNEGIEKVESNAFRVGSYMYNYEINFPKEEYYYVNNNILEEGYNSYALIVNFKEHIHNWVRTSSEVRYVSTRSYSQYQSVEYECDECHETKIENYELSVIELSKEAFHNWLDTVDVIAKEDIYEAVYAYKEPEQQMPTTETYWPSDANWSETLGIFYRDSDWFTAFEAEHTDVTYHGLVDQYGHIYCADYCYKDGTKNVYASLVYRPEGMQISITDDVTHAVTTYTLIQEPQIN